MNKNVKKFIEGKIFTYCKLLMVSTKVRFFFIIVSQNFCIRCLIAIRQRNDQLLRAVENHEDSKIVYFLKSSLKKAF